MRADGVKVNLVTVAQVVVALPVVGTGAVEARGRLRGRRGRRGRSGRRLRAHGSTLVLAADEFRLR